MHALHAPAARALWLRRSLHDNSIGGTVPASLSALVKLEDLCASLPIMAPMVDKETDPSMDISMHANVHRHVRRHAQYICVYIK